MAQLIIQHQVDKSFFKKGFVICKEDLRRNGTFIQDTFMKNPDITVVFNGKKYAAKLNHVGVDRYRMMFRMDLVNAFQKEFGECFDVVTNSKGKTDCKLKSGLNITVGFFSTMVDNTWEARIISSLSKADEMSAYNQNREAKTHQKPEEYEQIFYDLVQLFDRNEKEESENPIKANKDLRRRLKKDDRLEKKENDIYNCELELPIDMNWLATMNTSDQLLSLMESVLKRRRKRELMKIDYENSVSENYQTYIDANHEYDLNEFIRQVDINDIAVSEDKHLEKFCVKNEIETFE